MHNIRRHLLLCLAVLLLSMPSVSVGWVKGHYISARIIGSYQNNELSAAIELILPEGWNTYWRSKGGGQFAPSLSGAQGKEAKLLFPVPQRIEILGIQDIGYTGRVIFPLQLTDKAKNNTKIKLTFTTLTCSDKICVPEKVDLSFDANNLEEDSIEGSIEGSKSFPLIIAEAKSSLATLATEGQQANDPALIGATMTPDLKVLELEFANINNFDVKDIFIENAGSDYMAKPKSVGASKFRIVSKQALSPKGQITITLAGAKKAIEFSSNLANARIDAGSTLDFIYIAWLAFFGGFLLNFTPCVLPVIALKVTSLASGNRKLSSKSFFQRLMALSTAFGMFAGIFFIGLLFTALSFFFKGFLGWGVTFQSPVFLAFLILLLFAFGLNLLGFWAIPQASKLANKISGFSSQFSSHDFVTGVVISLLSLSCLAPYLGVVAAFAFGGDIINIIFIFSLIAFGLITPYVLIAIFPSLIKFLPKSGRWLYWLKVFSGVILILTSFWFLYILALGKGLLLPVILAVSAFLVVTLLRFAKKTPAFIYIAILISGLAMLSPFAFNSKKILFNDDFWLEYSPKLEQSIKQANETAMIYVTAEWCITCKVNEALVLSKDNFKDLFQNSPDNKIRKALKADWTVPDDDIAKLLSDNKRFGIPFTLIVGKNRPNGIILPEILSYKIIKEALELAEE